MSAICPTDTAASSLSTSESHSPQESEPTSPTLVNVPSLMSPTPRSSQNLHPHLKGETLDKVSLPTNPSLVNVPSLMSPTPRSSQNLHPQLKGETLDKVNGIAWLHHNIVFLSPLNIIKLSISIYFEEK